MTIAHPPIVEPLSAEDGGGYLATVPDVPGCMADGKTPDEATRNVADAIEQWLDTARARGMPIPAPRGRIAVVEA